MSAPLNEGQPLDGPPPYLTTDQAAVWREILAVAPLGRLTEHHVSFMEVVCCLVLRVRASARLRHELREQLWKAGLALERGGTRIERARSIPRRPHA